MAEFYFDVEPISRGGNRSAAGGFNYAAREGRHSRGTGADELALLEHGNMPKWAADNAREYWEATDLFERGNGCLYRQAVVALPVELSLEQNKVLLRRIAKVLSDGNKPHTLALHDKDGNPHGHIMVSERALDGHDRTAKTWFKRANRKRPKRGGAAKDRSVHKYGYLWAKRKAVADCINGMLAEAGRPERVDHRKLSEQRRNALKRGDYAAAAQLNRVPGVHRGAAMTANADRVPNRVAAVNAKRRKLAERHELEGQRERLAEALEAQAELARASAQLQALAMMETAPTTGAPGKCRGPTAPPRTHLADLAAAREAAADVARPEARNTPEAPPPRTHLADLAAAREAAADIARPEAPVRPIQRPRPVERQPDAAAPTPKLPEPRGGKAGNVEVGSAGKGDIPVPQKETGRSRVR